MRAPRESRPAPAGSRPSGGGPPHHALLWGTARGIERLLRLFEHHPRRGWRAAAAYCAEGRPELPGEVARWSSPPESEELAEAGIDAVVYALPPSALRPAWSPDLPVYQGRALIESWDRQIPVDLLDPDEEIRPRHRVGARGLLPRLLDLMLAAPAALLTLPLVGLLALLVRLESPGPALFTQWRVGERGRRFRIWKLRTMREGADRGPARTTRPGDERITAVGGVLRRWRLDELPQLWNVLLGDMSLIGPRPEQPEIFDEMLGDLPHLEARLAVRPGLTGWAQVRYGYVSSPEEMREKFGYDLWYLRRGNLLLDLEILARTLGVVLSGRGVR